MGPFDDLLPKAKPGEKPPGPFDDLVPKATVGGALKQLGASAIEGTGSIFQGGGEIVAGALNKVTGRQDFRAANPLKALADSIRDSMSAGDKAAAADQASGDLLDPSTWKLPQTAGGFVHSTAQGLGSVVPTLATALATRGRGMAPAMAAQGGLMTGGAAAGDVREDAARLSDEEFAAQSPAFRDALARGESPSVARARIENESAQTAGLLSGVLGAAGGAVNAKLIDDLIAKKGVSALLGEKLAGQGVARTAVGAGAGMVGEGLQEVAEKVGQNVGQNVGMGRDAGDGALKDTFGDFFSGSLVGGVTGGVGGALSKPPVTPNGTVLDPGAGAISKAATVAVQTGAAQTRADAEAAQVADQAQKQEADAAQQAQDAEAKSFAGKPQFDDPQKWFESLNGAGQTALIQKLEGAERATALDLMALARNPETSGPIRARAAEMLYGIAENIAFPGVRAPVSPLALPFNPNVGSDERGRANIEKWSAELPPMSLDEAQRFAREEAPARGRDDMTVVPHASGEGYTVVPRAWTGKAVASESASLQARGSGALPSPETERAGVMIAGRDGVRSQTYGDLDTTAQRAISEAQSTLGAQTRRPGDLDQRAEVIRNREPDTAVSTQVKPPPLEGEYQSARQLFPFRSQEQAQARAEAASQQFGEPYEVTAHPSVDGAFAIVPKSAASQSSEPTVLKAEEDFNFGIQNKPNIVASPNKTGLSVIQSPIDRAAQTAATSFLNDRSQPTEAQKQAGNYAKGHTKIAGLDISIENPIGSVRSGTNADGKEWNTVMRSHYGYIRRTTGADTDQVDTFIKAGTKPEFDGPVFVVDQVDPVTRKFDEHKVLIGYGNQIEAAAAYRNNYERGWKGMGKITPMPMDEFRQWVRSDAATKPLALEDKRNDDISERGVQAVRGDGAPSDSVAAQNRADRQNERAPDESAAEVKSDAIPAGANESRGSNLADATEPQSDGASVAKPERLVALRKRLSVLKSLKACLG